MLIGASALALVCSLSAAQTTTKSNSSAGNLSYSSSALPSSSSYLAELNSDSLFNSDSALGLPPAYGAANPAGSPQYGKSRYPQYPSYQSKLSHIAIVAGGGFTAPIGNATHGYETWGYNLDVGGGWNFTKRYGILFEYQFDRNKIPGATIAQVGAQGGNINSHLFLFDPIVYLRPKSALDPYVTGGGGFSRKVTNFTDLVPTQYCYYFCYYGYQPVTVAHFSSTQAAADIGLGLAWKAFGQDSNGKLFMEARYVFVDSPSATTTTNGEGTEGIIPVTFGVRW
jgi:hypothetical protein